MEKILILMVFLGTVMSCSPRLTPFSANLRNEYGWTDEELKDIQFYLSDEIVLWRKVREGDARITNGQIMIKDGQKVEEIRFPKRTPGVFLFEPTSNRFAVSFETDDNKYLMFGPTKKRAEFVLLAADWGKNSGQISYDDRIFRTSSESAYTRLMVDLNKAKKLSVKRRTAKGRTI